MKNLKILLLAILAIGLYSCDQEDEPINTVYDNTNGQSLISFQGNSSDLPVVIDDTGSVDVIIESSTISSSARTINISIDPESTADAGNYSLSSSTVTIPANEYFGSVTISGVDNTVETTAETILLNIDSTSSESTLGTSTHTVNIFQVCPIPDDYFVGNYLIEQLSPQIDGYSLSHNSVVEVVASGDTQRTFATEAYITYCAGNFFDFPINLVCNSLIVPLTNTTCSCGMPEEWWGPATTPETYDVSDDNVILLTFTDDVQSNCGSPAQTTYRFTKQ